MRAGYPALLHFLLLFVLSSQSHPPGQQLQENDTALSRPFYYEFKGNTDPDIWEKSYSTFPGNSCSFIPEAAVDGTESVSLWVKSVPDPVMGKEYGSGQLWSKRFFTYGTFTVRMKAPIVPGTVASFFLMNRITEGNWLHKEIDIEFLGKDRHFIQFNVHRYHVQTESAYGSPFNYRSSFDYGTDFHTYTIVWKKKSVEWYVDGEMAHRTNYHVPDEPLQMLMNVWIADPSFGIGWLGKLNESSLPCCAEYQWVRYEPSK